MERDGQRRHRKTEEKKEGRKKRRGRGRRKADFLPTRKFPCCWAPENPQTRPLPPPSPPDHPLPLCLPARLRWFPCGRFVFKNADAVPPARPSHCGHRGLSQAQGPHPAVGREGGVKEGKQPQANRRPQPWGAEIPRVPRGQGQEEQDTRPTEMVLEAKSWPPG